MAIVPCSPKAGLAVALVSLFGFHLVAVGCSVVNAPDDVQEPGSSGSGGSTSGGLSGGGGSGGTGAGATGGSTSGGGSGGGDCVAANCPGEDTTCQTRVCVNNACDFEYADAGTACTEDGGESCDGQGTCLKGDGTACGGDGECINGHCVDGVCCGTLCDGLCEGCNLTATEGTCTPHPTDTDPDQDCGTNQLCDGAGVCLTVDGAACTAHSECLNGNCPSEDGVCCDTPCTGSCQSCTAQYNGGTDGVCGPTTSGIDPDNDCSGSQNCNGSGGCGCPAASGNTIAGAHVQYGFCWYLTAPGVTCDQACSALGGANLAVSAQNAWPDNCGGPQSNDVSYWFFTNGNAAGWIAGPASTSYHTLGYGYTGQAYYGKCAAGTATGHGTFPGDPNNDTTRALVCPCFTS